jgi:hypothetical protein
MNDLSCAQKSGPLQVVEYLIRYFGQGCRAARNDAGGDFMASENSRLHQEVTVFLACPARTQKRSYLSTTE